MRRVLAGLGLFIAILSALAAAAGLFWPSEEAVPATYVTPHGTTVDLYGRELYRHASRFSGAGFVGQDVVTLIVAAPLLLTATCLHLRGTRRSALLLTAILSYFLYAYASMALSAAYNELFLVYVALFSASLFSLYLGYREAARRTVPARPMGDLPRVGPAALMFAAGVVTLVVWTAPLLSALLAERTPRRLDATTKVTEALDLAIITPLTFVAGTLILKRTLAGYLLAVPLLGLLIMLVPTIAAATVSQIRAGVSFAPAEIIGPLSGFLVLGALAVWVLTIILRSVADRPARRDSIP